MNNTQIDNAEYNDIVMPMYNLVEYSNNYLKTFGSLWQYCKEIPVANNDGDIVDFNGAKATDSFNFKTKTTGQTNNNGKIDVEIMVSLKCMSTFLRPLEMLLINWSWTYFDMVCGQCYNLHWCCKWKSNIYNNRDKSFCSCSFFINSR